MENKHIEVEIKLPSNNTKKVKDFIGEDTLETFQRITI